MSIAEKNLYKHRVIDDQVERYLANFGAVCIEGPKWCGKTWTSSFHCKSEFLVGDPNNNFQNRQLAELSPSVVLQGDTPRLIDEWQEVPSLWDAVRYMVDKRGSRSQFILTGSSTPHRRGVLHSGAGRIGRLRMRTMSLYESGDSSGKVSLRDLCNGKLESVMTGEVELQDLIYYVVRGGWPGNIGVSVQDAQLLPDSYINAIMEDDIYRLDDVKYDVQKMWLLLRSLARNESTTSTNSRLLKDIKEVEDKTIDRETLSQYLDVFNRLFLIEDQLPFSPEVRSSVRLKQASKRHFSDPALACALMKATPDRLLHDLNTFGFLFEALCERDLRIYAESFDGKIFHYQDYANQEADAVIELPDGQWCAFEIKVGANQIDSAAKTLISIKESFEKEDKGIPPSVLCVICGMSNAAYQRPDGVFVVPITALKD